MSEFYASSERDDWMTPSHILCAVGCVRDIELDPCAPIDSRNWIAVYNVNGDGRHRLHFSVHDGPCDGDLSYGECQECQETRISGLDVDWCLATSGGGLVYVNPPYGGRKGVINEWMDKCASEASRGCEIIGLVPASTGSKWFGTIWRSSDAICFVRGRLKFSQPQRDGATVAQLRLFDAGEEVVTSTDGSATFWSVMPYWGRDPGRFEEAFRDLGEVVFPSGGGLDSKAIGDA